MPKQTPGSSNPKSPYTLKSPCKDCPFRADNKFFLTPERAQGIMDESYEDSNFYCHKTLDYSSDDGEGQLTSKSRVCAGFLVTMEKEGRANQPTRIAERLGLYDRAEMDLNAPTYDSMSEWVRSHSPESVEGDKEDLEHYDVVGPHCSDPAGFLRNGEVFDNPSPPACSTYCSVCESPMCPECTELDGGDDGGPACVQCA